MTLEQENTNLFIKLKENNELIIIYKYFISK